MILLKGTDWEMTPGEALIFLIWPFFYFIVIPLAWTAYLLLVAAISFWEWVCRRLA